MINAVLRALCMALAMGWQILVVVLGFALSGFAGSPFSLGKWLDSCRPIGRVSMAIALALGPRLVLFLCSVALAARLFPQGVQFHRPPWRLKWPPQSRPRNPASSCWRPGLALTIGRIRRLPIMVDC